MFCSKCGREIVSGYKFCSGCGATVEEDTAPQPTKTYEASVSKSKSKKRKSEGKVVLSVFLAIVLFFLVVAVILSVGFRRFSSEDAIKEMVECADIANIDISEITGERNQELDEFIYDVANEKMPGVLSKQELRDILESRKTKEYIAGIINDSLDYLLTGKGSIEISSDDVIELLEDTGINLTEQEKEQIETEMKYNELEELDIADIIDDNGGVFEKVRFFGAAMLLYIFIAAIILIVILLFVINIRYIEKAFLDISIPTFLGGLAVWTPMLFVSNIKEAMSSMEMIPADIINLLIDRISGNISQISVIPMAIGAILFVTFVVISFGKAVIQKRK